VSATKRGAARVPLDHYRTPRWCVEALIRREWLAPLFSEAGELPTFLDPGCGDGAILRALRDCLPPPGSFLGVELDPTRAAAARRGGLQVIEGDFLSYAEQWTGSPRVQAVVGNPPYRQAADFVRAALKIIPPTGKVAFLLRLNFLGSSRKRQDIVGAGSPLERVLVLSRRPSFTGNGKTDACDYAWFVWTRGSHNSARLSVI